MNIEALQGNWVGELVDGGFPLLKWLGGTQHSAVFLTELPEGKYQKAAIKLVSADAGDAGSRMSRLRAAMGLHHPHLLRLFHIGQCEIDATPLIYVVMEYADEDLSKVIPSRPLTAVEAGQMLLPVLDALSHIHEKQMVHGRITPSNIMAVDDDLRLSSDVIRKSGELDTNAPKLRDCDAPENATGVMRPASDVWSLGVMLMTALTQHRPAWQDSGELMLPPSVAEPFPGIIRACLRRDPRERCTLAEIKDRLQSPSPPSVVAAQASAAPSTTTDGRVSKNHPKRRLLAPIAIGLIALAAVGGIRLMMHRTEAVPNHNSRKEENHSARNTPPPSSSRTSVALRTSDLARGAVARRVLPDVPQKARNTIRGTVRVGVRVSVNADGNVIAANLDSSGPSTYFANLALEAAPHWKFRPPQVDGRDVTSEWILHFRFGHSETQVDPTQITPPNSK